MIRFLIFVILLLFSTFVNTAVVLDVNYSKLWGYQYFDGNSRDMWTKGGVSRVELRLEWQSDSCWYINGVVGHQSHLESADFTGDERAKSSAVDYRGLGAGCRKIF